MEIKKTIEEIEAQMAQFQARIDAVRVVTEPAQLELDALNLQAQEIQAAALAKKAEIDAVRGPDWVELKRKLGILASTRMQLKAALKTIEGG